MNRLLNLSNQPVDALKLSRSVDSAFYCAEKCFAFSLRSGPEIGVPLLNKPRNTVFSNSCSSTSDILAERNFFVTANVQISGTNKFFPEKKSDIFPSTRSSCSFQRGTTKKVAIFNSSRLFKTCSALN